VDGEGSGRCSGSRLKLFRDNVNHLIRFHFAKKEETLAEAVKRLEKLKDKARERWR